MQRAEERAPCHAERRRLVRGRRPCPARFAGDAGSPDAWRPAPGSASVPRAFLAHHVRDPFAFSSIFTTGIRIFVRDYVQKTILSMGINYKEELNPSQLEAVLYTDGPSLVIAGAGSGKTRVLIYKIAYLLDKDIHKEGALKPFNILALTFTNKAAREMRERSNYHPVGARRAESLWLGTFHSVFAHMLRVEANRIGFTSSFTIYDQADSLSLIRAIIREMQLDDKKYKPKLVLSIISSAKNRLVSPAAYQVSSECIQHDRNAGIPCIGKIYQCYVERCRQADAMDFDDILVHTYNFLVENPDRCAYYERLFRYVLVDEYQDTNYVQDKIIWELTKTNKRLCVVGDDAQSIYSFRGANVDNILNFQKVYKGTRLFKLEQNYRSTQTIVSAANSLIKHNLRQIQKEVFSRKAVGEPLIVAAAYSDVEEADIVVNRIAELHRRADLEYSDCAILYRTNAQSRTFEDALRRQAIPYRIYGGLSFYQRKEVKDTIAYFRLAVNPHDEEALKRVINYPARGIGQTTLDKIAVAAADAEVSFWQVISRPAQYGLQVNRGTLAKLGAFTALIGGFAEAVETLDAATLGMRILQESGILREINQDRSPENVSRQENVQELMNVMQEFVADRQEEGSGDYVRLPDFLQEVALWTDQDQDEGEDDDRKVTLMTIHAAKGLEFRAVFIVGLEENLFPNAMTGLSQRELEEERRLFYVALTRAEEYCFLSYARSRFRFGKMEFSSPSRFLNEIDPAYLSYAQGGALFGPAGREADAAPHRSLWTDRAVRSEASEAPRRSLWADRSARNESSEAPRPPLPLASSPSGASRKLRRVPTADASPSRPSQAPAGSGVQAGQTIEHERFGLGRVLCVEGSGENAKATVEFQHAGKKQLLLRFARFKVVE